MQGNGAKTPTFLSKFALIIIPLLCSLILSCEAIGTATALYKRDSEPKSKTSYRSNSRSPRNRNDSERQKARESNKPGPKDVWTKYMAKFDIAESHGSGIYVDLGGNATLGGQQYRMPAGKCPVIGKVVTLGNGADFLTPVSTTDPRERGLAFPETFTKIPNTQTQRSRGRTRPKEDETRISPVSAEDLIKWKYEGNDVANCAEYASNIVPQSDKDTKYRYPFVYDSKEEMCHILYTPIQYNQGSRYCDNDGSKDEGASSLLCMRPLKSDIDSHLYYGSANLDPNWEENCPMSPVRDAIFGRWSNGSCVAISPAFEEYTDGAEDCAALVFEYSAVDLNIDQANESYRELDELKAGLKSADFAKIATALFGPISTPGTSAKNSRGVGMNWANYDTNTGLCAILAETPNCLIINSGSLALNALGSPLEQDAVNYPCDIDTNGYVAPRQRSTSRNSKPQFEVTTALKKDTLKCSKYVREKKSESCGIYYYCSEEPDTLLQGLTCNPGDPQCVGSSIRLWRIRRFGKYIITALALILLILAIYWTYRRLWSSKFHSSDTSEYDRLMSKYEYEEASHSHARSEQKLKSDAYIWGEAAARPSDVTPVHLSKLE